MLAAKLVIGPNAAGVNIEVSYILIHGGGQMYVGDKACRYVDPVDIQLWGR